MAPRSKLAIHKPIRGVCKNVAIDAGLLLHSADLLDYGEITIGTLDPVGVVATAVDGLNCLVMLVSRDDATLLQMLHDSTSPSHSPSPTKSIRHAEALVQRSRYRLPSHTSRVHNQNRGHNHTYETIKNAAGKPRLPVIKDDLVL